MKQVFSFLWQSIKNYRYYYLCMILAPVLGAFYKPIVYYAIKMMVDIITKVDKISIGQLMVPLCIYIIADVFLSVVWRASNIAAWKSEPYVQQGILLRALSTVSSFRYVFFQNVAGGSIVSKIKGLYDGYTELWAQLWYGVTFWILASITAIVSIILVNIKLGVLLLIWSIVYITINYFVAKKINQLSQAQNEAKHGVMGEIADSLSNIHSIKLYSTRKYEYQRLNDSIKGHLIPKEIRLSKFRFKTDILNDLMGIGIIVIMILFMIQLKQANQVTVGDFVFVFSMVFQFQENLWHLMQEFHKLSDRMGDLKSSLSIYAADRSEYNDSTIKINSTLPNIIFKNVNFQYDGNKVVFKNLNLNIKAGERIGIIGFTGGGKTTLINLLLKVFTPQSGNILINGQDIVAMDCDYLRQNIALIPQDVALFHRNLLENIRYGRLDASDAEVEEAARKAHADEFISALPDGYHTMVGERGIKLSGGQRQRIAIARAILKNAPILILDEATSALDSITESYIQEAILKILEGKTVLAIAHRLSTLKNMDRLIVIDNGEIVESGTHDQLLAQTDSLYAKIWHTQHA